MAVQVLISDVFWRQSMGMPFTVLAYDIADNHRRARVASIMADVSTRVQESVFEGFLDEATLERTCQRLNKVIDPSSDTVRIYRVCKTCYAQTRLLGQGQLKRDVPTMVI